MAEVANIAKLATATFETFADNPPRFAVRLIPNSFGVTAMIHGVRLMFDIFEQGAEHIELLYLYMQNSLSRQIARCIDVAFTRHFTLM